MKYADVIVDISAEQLDRHFQYRIPAALENSVYPGVQVEIPFGAGNKVIRGYVMQITNQPDYDPKKIKDIRSLCERSETVESRMMELAVWIRKTYGCTMLQALRTVLPIRQKTERHIKKKIVRTAEKEEILSRIQEERRKNHRARERFLCYVLEHEEAEYSSCIKELKLNAGILKAFEKEGVVRIVDATASVPMKVSGMHRDLPILTAEQVKALTEIREEWKRQTPRPVLLHGITGSGKTMLYMHLIEQTLREGRQAILLVPEIALTYQNVERFCQCFQDKVAILHSRLSAGEKAQQFERARNGSASIMIGPRSALFAPFPNLGLIIVDEEQETSYHSEKTPRYHAREAAVERGRLEKAHVVLGSATPSLEAAWRCEQGLYKKVELNSRYGRHGLPTVYITDMREELKSGNRSVFSRQLLTSLRECLDRKEQALLFLNRRGYAGFISCRMCGYVIKCPHCDVSMTMHRDGRLVCHYCGRSKSPVNVCPSCGSPYISAFRAGTQQIEEMLHREFPEARILRMDMDTTRHKNDHEEIIRTFGEHKADILIGTQMIVKGHDFPEVTLVGVLAADMSLFSADYRSAERTFQLLTQAIGRAGRAEKAGCAVIQTYHPEHYAIEAAAVQDYGQFYQQEIGYRELMGYPPASSLLAIHVSFTDADRLDMAMTYLKRFLERITQKAEVQIIGPADEAVAKINDMYRRAIYIKGKDEQLLKILREQTEHYIEINKGFEAMYIQYDLNA